MAVAKENNNNPGHTALVTTVLNTVLTAEECSSADETEVTVAWHGNGKVAGINEKGDS